MRFLKLEKLGERERWEREMIVLGADQFLLIGQHCGKNGTFLGGNWDRWQTCFLTREKIFLD